MLPNTRLVGPLLPSLLAICLLALPGCASPSLDTQDPPPPASSAEDQLRLVRAEATEDRPDAIEFTGRAQVEGMMQIYWQDQTLHARFLLDMDRPEQLPEMPSDPYDRTPSILGFHPDSADIATELLQHFDALPENFLRYEEGHIELPGTLTLRGLSSIIECDAPYTFTEFESFQPMEWTDPSRYYVEHLLAQPRQTGCGDLAPWQESFVLNQGQAIYTEPREGADIVAVPTMPVVFKIRTFDDHWIQVYSYADPDLRGFVRSDQLEPVN